MKNKINTFIVAVGIFTSSSCQRPVSKQELFNYINDDSNSLTCVNLIHGVNYRITYKPVDLVDPKMIRVENLASDCFYFILQASINNNDLFLTKKSDFSYDELLKRFAFQLNNYVYAVYDKNDTIQALQCVFSRNYATTNSTSAMLVFKKRKEFESLKIVFKDIVYDSGEYAKFNFTQDNINKTPKIITDENNGQPNG